MGAGPTGLMTAVLLARKGVRVRLFDKNTQQAHESRALGVQARSLELFLSLGLADAFLDRGTIVTGGRMFVDGQQAAELSFDGIGRTDTPFGFVLIVPQRDTESHPQRRVAAAGRGRRAAGGGHGLRAGGGRRDRPGEGGGRHGLRGAGGVSHRRGRSPQLRAQGARPVVRGRGVRAGFPVGGLPDQPAAGAGPPDVFPQRQAFRRLFSAAGRGRAGRGSS